MYLQFPAKGLADTRCLVNDIKCNEMGCRPRCECLSSCPSSFPFPLAGVICHPSRGEYHACLGMVPKGCHMDLSCCQDGHVPQILSRRWRQGSTPSPQPGNTTSNRCADRPGGGLGNMDHEVALCFFGKSFPPSGTHFLL